jgi:hypothetical protein
MGRWLRQQDIAALMQVHTHPDTWVGHSSTDDDFSIASSEGFMSIVWPNFAALPVTDAAQLGVHRLEGGSWRQLSAAQATDLIRVEESEGFIWVHAAEDPAKAFSTKRRGGTTREAG